MHPLQHARYRHTAAGTVSMHVPSAAYDGSARGQRKGFLRPTVRRFTSSYLCAFYAMSGTHTAYGATSASATISFPLRTERRVSCDTYPTTALRVRNVYASTEMSPSYYQVQPLPTILAEARKTLPGTLYTSFELSSTDLARRL
eukprot:913959-Rhodomonas_salina.5